MNAKFFDIQLRLNYMTKLKPLEQEAFFKKLIPKLKSNFIRFEIFYEAEYYHKKISLWQKEINIHVANMEYSKAASARPNTIFWAKQLYLSEIYFHLQIPPYFTINSNGLIRVYVNSVKDVELIKLIDDFSKLF